MSCRLVLKIRVVSFRCGPMFVSNVITLILWCTAVVQCTVSISQGRLQPRGCVEEGEEEPAPQHAVILFCARLLGRRMQYELI